MQHTFKTLIMMNEKTLIDIGLSKNEAKVYLTLIEMGNASILDISKRNKVHRTNIYDALDRLKQKGFVFTFTKNNKNYYEAADPDRILNYLKEKEIKLIEILPSLRLSKDFTKPKTEAGIYEGVVANRRLLEGFLKFKEDIFAYGLPKGNTDLSGKWWIDSFHKKRIARKQNMIHIYNENAKQRIKYLNNLPYTEAKYLPKEYNSPVSIEMCGDEVLITSWDKPLVSILIKNKEISKTFKNYFRVLYGIAKV